VNYLIDTNVISEVRKGPRADPNVSAWYGSISDDSLYLSVLVLGEIRRGIERRRPQDAGQAAALERWLAAILRGFSDRILPIDRAVADEWGRMGVSRPISVVDGLIAATAKVHAMTLVTRNIADVRDLGVAALNPFASSREAG
jgi:hypothetical protein